MRLDLLTRIVVIPFGNMLGALLAFVLLSPIFLLIAVARTPSKWYLPLFVVSGVAVAVIDIAVRRRSQAPERWMRWLSWYEGGNLFLVPCWALGIAVAVLPVLAVLKSTR